jgi:hypothetical protein
MNADRAVNLSVGSLSTRIPAFQDLCYLSCIAARATCSCERSSAALYGCRHSPCLTFDLFVIYGVSPLKLFATVMSLALIFKSALSAA